MTHHVPWSIAKGATVIEFWLEDVQSGTARGLRQQVRYKDKNGKAQVCTCWVKWALPGEKNIEPYPGCR